MPTISQAFSEANRLFRAGRLQEAGNLCEQIVAADPTHASVWHLWGLLKAELGQFDSAVERLSRSLVLEPNQPFAHSDLGVIFGKEKRWGEAEKCFRRAVELLANDSDICSNLAAALREQKKLTDAITWYRRSLELNPGSSEIKSNLSTVLQELGLTLHEKRDLLGAVENYLLALELNPADAGILFNLGKAYEDQERLSEAIRRYQQALQLKPNFFEALLNLGCVLKKTGNRHDAISCWRRALEMRPDSAEIYCNLGLEDFDAGRLPEAIENYRAALRLQPDLAQAHHNLAAALREQGFLDEAEASYRQALALDPSFADAHAQLATLFLLKGDFERGWPYFEWRWNTGQLAKREFRSPRWQGEALTDKTILLHAEQGLGDTFQFIRYAAIVKKLASTVIVECQRPLVSVLAGCTGIDCLIPTGDPLPTFDFHAPLLSVPAILKTSLLTIPATVPYMFADPKRIAQWKLEIGDANEFRIGINWRGRTGQRGSQQRDLPLNFFEALRLPGVQLVNLQQGIPAQEMAEAHDRLRLIDLGNDVDKLHGAFMDTAAIMKNLDLVITSDTSVAHLAGALGMPVWVALTFIPDWRWLLNRSDSPWYPTMRLFRQDKPDNWSAVLHDMQSALRSMLDGIAVKDSR